MSIIGGSVVPDKFVSPHHRLLKALLKHRVEYIVIGVSGINYYARDARQIVSTVGYDLFVESKADNIYRALKALKSEGFSTAYASPAQRLVPIRKFTRGVCENLVRKKCVIVAEGPYRVLFELLQEVSGFTFQEMRRRSVKMKDKTAHIVFPVGHLEDLIESKRRAGRKKDRLFLEKFQDMLLSQEGPGRKRRET